MPATAPPSPVAAPKQPWQLWAVVGGGLLAVVVGLVIFLSGGSDESVSTDVGPQPADAGASPGAGETDAVVAGSPVDASPAGISCTNTTFGYSLVYPADWHTLSHRPAQDCRFFSDQPLDFGPSVSTPNVPIGIDRIDLTIEDLRDLYEDPANGGATTRDLTVDGHRAAVLELNPENPEDGGYLYLIELDSGKPLVLAVPTRYATDYEAAKAVLDAMVGSLDLL